MFPQFSKSLLSLATAPRIRATRRGATAFAVASYDASSAQLNNRQQELPTNDLELDNGNA